MAATTTRAAPPQQRAAGAADDGARPPASAEIPRAARTGLVALGVVIAVAVPAAWLLGAWAVGPRLNHAQLPFLTPLLYTVVLLGMPASMLLLFRWLFRIEARLAQRAGQQPTLRFRATHRGRLRPATPVLDPDPLPELTPARRTAAVALIGVMFVGTLCVWVGAPLWSIWLVSQIAGSTRPAMWPYALVAVGIAVTMALGVRLLALIHGAYTRLTRIEGARGRRPTGWLRSYTDDRAVRRSQRGLEAAMVAAVIVALVLLVIWFFLFTDPSGFLPPELQAN